MAIKDMLGIAVRKLMTLPDSELGVVYDLLGKMADPEWVEATKRFLRKEKSWPALLKPIKKVRLPVIEKFVVKDHFSMGKVVDGVSVFWVAEEFEQTFGNMTEKNVPAQNLLVYHLHKPALDMLIVDEIEGEVETNLATMWEVLKQGCNQQSGLSIDDVNVFYIRDAKGVLWGVSCLWVPDYAGWCFEARRAQFPHKFMICAGSRIFSRFIEGG